MPRFNLPTPTSWDHFEDICLSSFKAKFNIVDFQRHGRQGQKQNGVDIYGIVDSKNIGIQCKNTITQITTKTIDTEIANAESFSPPLDKLYIATSAPADVDLQSYERQINQSRKAKGKFELHLEFWGSITNELEKVPHEIQRHYPQFYNNLLDSDKSLMKKLLETLPPQGSIKFINDHNFGWSYRDERTSDLDAFYYEWNDTLHEFIDPEMEAAKQQLHSKVVESMNAISLNTYSLNNPNIRAVELDLEFTDNARFMRIVESINTPCREAYAAYQELIRIGRRKGLV